MTSTLSLRCIIFTRLVFFAFYVYHVDWNHSAPSMSPILLFFIDRFLRMVQSRRQVTGLSARILPSSLVELKIPKQTGFKYSTLSFVFLSVPGLSKLQWHPFSNSSSPLIDNNEMSVASKPFATGRLTSTTSATNLPTTPSHQGAHSN